MNSENNKKEDAQTDGHPLAEFIIIYLAKKMISCAKIYNYTVT